MRRFSIPAIGVILFATAFLWFGISSAGESEQGKNLYTAKCLLCHGIRGDGNGRAAAYLGSKPADLTDPGFWRDNDEKKIANIIENGQDEMPAFELNPEEMKALIGYLRTFNPSAK